MQGSFAGHLAVVALAILVAGRGSCAQRPTSTPAALNILDDGARLHAFGGSIYDTSTDGGRTWLPVPRTAPVTIAGLVAQGDSLLVISDSLTAHRSVDGGRTWLPPSFVTTPTGTVYQVKVCETAGVVLVLWTERRLGAGEVFCNRSTDGGQTWSAVDQRLDSGIPDQLSQWPSIGLDGATVHVLWVEGGPSESVCYRRSSDAGMTWNTAATQLAPATGPAMFTPRSGPSVVADGGTVLVACGTGVLRSADGGNSWALAFATGPFVNVQQVALDGRRAVATGASNPLLPGLFCVASTDRGATWGNPWISPFGNNGIGSSWASILVRQDTVVLVDSYFWSVSGSFSHRYWAAVSHDGGSSFSFTTTSLGSSSWDHSWLVPLRSGVLLAVDRTASGGTELLAGNQTYGAGTAGTGGFEPMLRARGTPVLGNSTTLGLSLALGGAPALVVLGAAGPAAVPLGAATLLVQQPFVGFFFLTSGGVGAPGTGTAVLPIALPNDVRFSGLRLNGQAFVIDASAVGGFAATSGVEIWLL